MEIMKTAAQNQYEIAHDSELNGVLARLFAAKRELAIAIKMKDRDSAARMRIRIAALAKHAKELGWRPAKKAPRQHTRVNMRPAGLKK
jgi:hypothetical protein